MMTSQDFQDVVDRLQQQYPDFTTNQDSLQLMLDNNFELITTRYITMCDIEADKMYLWISADDWDNPDLKDISSIKLLHSIGYQISREHGGDDNDNSILVENTDYDSFNTTLRTAQEVYGTELFPNLSSFAGQKITCDSFGARTLGRQIMLDTGWTLQDPCPLVLHHQSYNFYQRHRGLGEGWRKIGGRLELRPKESSSVLYEGSTDSVAWNGWSGPFILYELTSLRPFTSLNYPAGLPLNR